MMVQKIKNFSDLISWQEGHKLVIQVYRETKNFPSSEQFGLTSQIRRAVISVTSNIAEGFNRSTKADKIHFYVMSQGSVSELQSQLLAARDIGFLAKERFAPLAEQTVVVHKLLTGLIKSIKR